MDRCHRRRRASTKWRQQWDSNPQIDSKAVVHAMALTNRAFQPALLTVCVDVFRSHLVEIYDYDVCAFLKQQLRVSFSRFSHGPSYLRVSWLSILSSGPYDCFHWPGGIFLYFNPLVDNGSPEAIFLNLYCPNYTQFRNILTLESLTGCLPSLITTK